MRLVVPHDFSSVRQVRNGDCYYLAPLAAVAHAQPHLLDSFVQPAGKKNLRVHFPGTPTVFTVKQGSWLDAVQQAWTQARAKQSRVDDTPEHALEAFTNKQATTYGLQPTTGMLRGRFSREKLQATAWRHLCAAAGVSTAMTEGTYAVLKSPVICNTPSGNFITKLAHLLADVCWAIGCFFGIASGTREAYMIAHSYAVLGVGNDATLGTYVDLYNPYGHTEGRRDGPDDGWFRVPMTELMDAFESYTEIAPG